MRRRQYCVALAVLAVAGLAGGVLGSSLFYGQGVVAAREWSEALILVRNEEDPVYMCLDSDVKALINKDTPTPVDIARTMNSWRDAVRESLRIAKVDGNIPDSLLNARP